MFRKTRFYVGISLLVQSVTFIVMTIIFLYRNKRNTAGAFFAVGLVGAIGGALLVTRQIRDQYEEDRIIDAINGICAEDDDDDEEPTAHRVEIPVDDTADETEFD